jgi:carboxyl-terminal processing protease
MKTRLVSICACLLLSILFLFSITSTSAYAFSEEQRLVNDVWRLVDRAYVDDTFNHQNWWAVRQKVLRNPMPDRESAYDVIDEMLATLDDPFTRLLRPNQYQSLQTSTSGELTGVGLQITRLQGQEALRVISPIDGSPADVAGIRPQDIILKIDGIPTSTLSLDEAAEKMRGIPGTRVVLTIANELQQERDVDIVRDRITLNPVYFSLKETGDGLDIGYIRLNQFNANATEAIAQAIQDLEEQGAAAYVLDLRNNPGGLLQAGIEVARFWLDQGVIVHTVNRFGIQDTVEAFGDALTDAPLAILVNGGTASASEILSGALHDNGRATLVGERTFGKGLIQSLFNLGDGAGLAVTVARYETPNHTDINTLGIQPDVEIPSELIGEKRIASADDLQYAKAVELLEGTVSTLAAMP